MFESINTKQVIILLGALFLVMVSAVSAAYSVHLTRQYVNQLSKLDRKQDALDVEWEKLLLEINMLAGYNRVEKTALKDLGMKAPSSEQLRVIEIEGKNR